MWFLASRLSNFLQDNILILADVFLWMENTLARALEGRPDVTSPTSPCMLGIPKGHNEISIVNFLLNEMTILPSTDILYIQINGH